MLLLFHSNFLEDDIHIFGNIIEISPTWAYDLTSEGGDPGDPGDPGEPGELGEG